jgi:uncharacterized protein (TIGR01777 family)
LGAEGNPTTVLVSGATGFVGTELCRSLQRSGYVVWRLVREHSQSTNEGFKDIVWSPMDGALDAKQLEGLEAVVHLAGESVNGRWTTNKKALIYDSRIVGTRTLTRALLALERPPKVVVSASAIGYYGDRGEELLTEDSLPANDFLAKVCADWERESEPLDAVCRRVNPRLGIVLGANGGALPQMAKPFQLGVGGKLGPGSQFVSWISLFDLCRLIQFCIEHPNVRGPINAVAPNPVTNEDLSHVLAAHFHTKAWLPAPSFALRIALGEFSTEVLASKRVLPKVARDNGFKWIHAELQQALQWAMPS